MSKNVAVFVDVANIFYAAKAGGVDIDYVTLLKAATAGRDFVRAYAYTGLDPENENQRQFHAFLARSGYKVVSKDIRKYGDGRIKANLDIELVVDMMRLARNLDIAVVVSGDGDFAPAIRAVQEMGVRVEVISFRGNTSADLIEVADQFTDIAQIARVDKTSARSGRRVAAEGDLSMTAVPEKETEGAPRRRRGRAAAERTDRVERVERDEREAAEAAAGMPGNLIVLPGERLSRAPDGAEADETEAAGEATLSAGEGTLSAADEAAEGDRRRRRRRGGRGRGRGRREEGREEGRPVGTLEGEPVSADEEEEEEYAAAPAAPPQHAFGSVWDTQIGLPSAPLPGASLGYTAEPADEDEDLEEPEVPEYLLAERRQRQRGGGGGGGRGRMGRGGRQGAYQAAIERERYGRGGGGGGGFSGPRLGDRPPRQDRQRSRGGQPPRAAGRPERPAEQRPSQPYGAPSSDPWSEVPAELEEMLRAELARRGGQPTDQAQPASPAEPAAEAEAPTETPARPKRATRGRTAAKAAAPAAKAATPAAEPASEPVGDKPKRTTRTRASKAADETAAAGEALATVDQGAETKPKRASRSRAAKAEPATADGAEASGEAAPPAKTRTRRKKTDEASAEG